jgi:hypothetical protein
MPDSSKKFKTDEDYDRYGASPEDDEDFADDEDKEATQMTCDVLCSLSSTSPRRGSEKSESPSFDCYDSKRRSSKTCPKQLQLPMFLSKTYHMIDRCDPEIATWSESGDNFVVKNVEKFASHVLPLYFKHSNFSSFARQLNFYGFRKLRTDPILTSDVDPRTACYVRFYHEKFQKDKPELLHQIKRATKTDQQSKDEVESLKLEIVKLRETLSLTAAQYDQKLAELSYECNRRITAMNAEYDKLAALVQHALQPLNPEAGAGIKPSLSVEPSSAATAPPQPPPPSKQAPDLLHSLSQAAVTLQNHIRLDASNGSSKSKRAALDGDLGSAARTRYS